MAVGTGAPPAATVTWIGASGTFGSLVGLTQTSTGHSLALQAVPGWGFGPGEAIFFTLATPSGQLILSTVPLTENELLTTTDHAEINVYDPAAGKFYRNLIPTQTGFVSALKPNFLVGGTDAGGGDLCMTQDGRVLFTCEGGWFGWAV